MELDLTKMQLWACQYKKEKPDKTTLSYGKRLSIAKLLAQAGNKHKWAWFARNGWRSVQVEVPGTIANKRLAAAPPKAVTSPSNATV